MPIWDSGVVVATEIVVASLKLALLTAAAVPVAVLTLLLLSTLFSFAGFVLTFVRER